MTNLHFQNLLFLGIIYYGQKPPKQNKKNFTPAPPYTQHTHMHWPTQTHTQ